MVKEQISASSNELIYALIAIEEMNKLYSYLLSFLSGY